jgi:hypothetical protein
MTHQFHLCLSIRGALSWPLRDFQRKIVPMLQHDDGRPMTEHEARNALFDELAQGHEVLPIGQCDNFDYTKGCQGHLMPEAADTPAVETPPDKNSYQGVRNGDSGA